MEMMFWIYLIGSYGGMEHLPTYKREMTKIECEDVREQINKELTAQWARVSAECVPVFVESRKK